MSSGKGSKLLRYIEHRIRVTLHDSRTIIGTFLAFDKHLNLVLVDTEEFRTLRSNKRGESNAGSDRASIIEERQEKRSLGLVIVRGENVVSICVEGPPPPEKRAKTSKAPPPMGMPNNNDNTGAGRGMMPPPGGAPMGLGAAPIHGVGGLPTSMPPPGMGRGMPPRY